MNILIKNATVLDMVNENVPNIEKKDILIKENIIYKIDNEILDIADKIIDAKNMIVMPGLVNTHTHLAMSIFRGYKNDIKLVDWLQNAIFPVEERLKPDDIYWNSYLSCIEMIKSGTTTFNDMYFRMDKTLEAAEKSGLRGIIAWSVTDNSIKDKLERTKEYFKKYSNKKDSKIKIYVSAHAPHTCNPETLKKCVDLAKELHTGIHIHLPETLKENEIIEKKYAQSGIEYLSDSDVFDVPVVLVHGTYIKDSDIPILEKIKGGISHTPRSNCKFSSNICNITKLHDANINVGLGTDGIETSSTMDMFEEMKVAAYLQKINTQEKVKISAYEILKMATIEGAKVLGSDKEIGTIEEGKKADIICINRNKTHLYPENDICSNLVYSANGADVDTVIVDGKILMKNRKLIDVNEKEVKKKVAKIVKRLL